MTLITINIILLITIVTGFIFEGLIDGWAYSGKASKAFKWNEHTLLRSHTAYKGFSMLITSVVTVWWLFIYGFGSAAILMMFADYFLVGIFSIFLFSFFHNWAYYWIRKRIDQPNIDNPLKYQSDTSTAENEFNYSERKTMAIIGLILTALGSGCLLWVMG